jgi:hypothetical protein
VQIRNRIKELRQVKASDLRPKTYHKTLRVNKYHYVHDHGHKPGGFVSMRTMATEEHCVARLIEKWGSRIVQPGGSKGRRHSTGKNILNTKIIVPINGC